MSLRQRAQHQQSDLVEHGRDGRRRQLQVHPLQDLPRKGR